MVLDVLHTSSGLVLILLTVSLMVAGVMKGIIGVGMPIVALPLLSMLIDVRAAVMLLSMPLILSNIPQAIEGGETVACFMRLIPVLLGMMPGLLLGVTVLVDGDPATTKVIAGSVIVLVAGHTLVAPRLQLRESLKTPVGVAAGLAGACSTVWQRCPGRWYLNICWRRACVAKNSRRRRRSSLSFRPRCWQYSCRPAIYSIGSTSALIPVGIGMYLGQRLRDLIPANFFKRAVLVVVLLSGKGLIYKAFVSN
jgi:uncharacterized membrane protein YfcA